MSSVLLRIFPEYRALHARLLQATSAKIALEDINRDLTAEVAQLRTQVAAAQHETIHSIKSVANWISQQTYGQKIYAEGVELPAQSAEAQIVNQRPNARRVCDEMEREFMERYETE